MHLAMMNAPEFSKHDLSSLRLAVTAGAICPEELIREMKAKYTVDTVGSLYGMTETSPVFFQSLPADSDALRSGTVGYPMEHCEVIYSPNIITCQHETGRHARRNAKQDAVNIYLLFLR
jgi:fatty-acyl-CoA synthase